MQQPLHQQTALITGASQGIGAATATALAQAGAAVVLLARNTSRLERLADQIQSQGGKALVSAGDVTRFADVQRACELANAQGNFQILVNNAGIIDPISHLHQADVEAWSHVVDVNIKGVFYSLRCALPHFMKAKAGTVINISSGAANAALEGWSHYCSTKAAVKMLTACAHKEAAHAGVHVVGLSPGTVATDMQRIIQRSGINPVSAIPFDRHIPASWVGKAVVHLATGGAQAHAGTDFSLKTEQGRKEAGLPPIGR